MYNENIFCCDFCAAVKNGPPNRKASNWWYFLLESFDKTLQKLCRMMMDSFLLQRSRSWSCLKLIAVIDCASKMMMSCARVVMHFFVRFAVALHFFFVSFLLRTIEEIFYHFCFLTLFTIIEQETHSILFSGFDLADFLLLIVYFKLLKNLTSTNHVVCACLNAD